VYVQIYFLDVHKLLKKLHEREATEQYQVTIKTKSTALEISKDNEDINRTRDTFRDVIKISAILDRSIISCGLMRNFQK
jgi:hypothetical protein